MSKRRTTHKLLSIFDLSNIPSKMTGKSSIRIMYEYDSLIGNVGEFTVLNNDIPRETANAIISWLEDNVPLRFLYDMNLQDLDFGIVENEKKAA